MTSDSQRHHGDFSTCMSQTLRGTHLPETAIGCASETGKHRAVLWLLCAHSCRVPQALLRPRTDLGLGLGPPDVIETNSPRPEPGRLLRQKVSPTAPSCTQRALVSACSALGSGPQPPGPAELGLAKRSRGWRTPRPTRPQRLTEGARPARPAPGTPGSLCVTPRTLQTQRN